MLLGFPLIGLCACKWSAEANIQLLGFSLPCGFLYEAQVQPGRPSLYPVIHIFPSHYAHPSNQRSGGVHSPFVSIPTSQSQRSVQPLNLLSPLLTAVILCF